MKIFITGANGMLASNVIEELLQRGYSVRGMLRHRESYKGLLHPSLELMEGDFTNITTVQTALEGCDCVIHAAAMIAQNEPRYREYRRVNVEATARLLECAWGHRIKRFVYVSSANTIGAGTAKTPGCEQTPLAPPLTGSLYGRSKLEAEAIVLSYARLMEVVVVNPTFMIGRYGSPSGSNRILKMARRITFCPSGGKSFLDVEDAARGVVAALERGRNGERYLLSGENLSFSAFFRLFPQVKHVVVVPSFLLLAAGCIGSLLRLFGLKTDFSLTNIRILLHPDAYSHAKAHQELGFILKNK